MKNQSTELLFEISHAGRRCHRLPTGVGQLDGVAVHRRRVNRRAEGYGDGAPHSKSRRAVGGRNRGDRGGGYPERPRAGAVEQRHEHRAPQETDLGRCRPDADLECGPLSHRDA